MKKVKKIRQYALVRLTDKARKQFKRYIEKDDSFLNERSFVFFGEIPNMPGHCVVVGHDSEKIYSGHHLDDFQELTENEV